MCRLAVATFATAYEKIVSAMVRLSYHASIPVQFIQQRLDTDKAHEHANELPVTQSLPTRRL